MEDSVSVPSGFGNRSLWSDLLTRWLTFLGAYERVCDSHGDPDLAYWHVEKSLTGLLGSAAWAINGWSLEEFCTDRVAGDSTSAGHGDVWLGRDHADATVEAKMCWIDHNVQDREKSVLDALGEARSQLNSLDPECQFGQLVSVCYIVPWYQKPKRGENGRKATLSLENFGRAQGFVTATHWAVTENIEDAGRKHPGVLLVAREERTQR
jgi:hypothetical protein